MTTSIFIRSYRGDRFWLDYCLRSLKKFATGFKETLVVLPKGDEPHFQSTDFRGARVLWWDDLPGDGYMGQMHCKMHADQMLDSDFIYFVDSDCFTQGPATPSDCMSGNKPIQLLRHWEDVGDAKMWKPITERAVKFTPAFEHMALIPLMYHRRTIADARTYMESTHGQSLGAYIQGVPFRSFSEFNAIGAFACRFQPHLYDWRLADPTTDGVPRTIRQHWSWGGLTPDIEAQFNQILS